MSVSGLPEPFVADAVREAPSSLPLERPPSLVRRASEFAAAVAQRVPAVRLYMGEGAQPSAQQVRYPPLRVVVESPVARIPPPVLAVDEDVQPPLDWR